MSVTIRVRRNDFSKIAAKLPVAAANIIGTRGEEMVGVARKLSRVDTGEMRDGWRFETKGKGGSGALTNDVSHTVHNEWGTRYMTAQPMARPAAEQVFPKILDDFQSLEKHIT